MISHPGPTAENGRCSARVGSTARVESIDVWSMGMSMSMELSSEPAAVLGSRLCLGAAGSTACSRANSPW